MKQELSAQIAELRESHKGLALVAETERETVLSGPLPFEASADGYASITASFEIDLLIPSLYPDDLPRVRETGGKIDGSYEHVYTDGTSCLAVPIAKRLIFSRQPSLLGFVNNLVIPYFYGYCHWKEHGEHPFGEQKHGVEGIVRHYVDTLELVDEVAALAVVLFLFEYGYRGHHDCPCGSGLKVRKCHGPILRDFHRHHTPETLRYDLQKVLGYCVEKLGAGQLSISAPLMRRICRLVDGSKRRLGFSKPLQPAVRRPLR